MTRTRLRVAAATITLALVACRAARPLDPELPCVPAVQYFESVRLPRLRAKELELFPRPSEAGGEIGVFFPGEV